MFSINGKSFTTIFFNKLIYSKLQNINYIKFYDTIQSFTKYIKMNILLYWL